MLSPPVVIVLDFLYKLFQDGLGYSALNTVRSALSSVIQVNGIAIGKHRLVTRFLRAVFNERPALPRNRVTWDVDIVLGYLRSLSPVRHLTVSLLTRKLLMLMLLLSGQRGQTIHLLDIKNFELSYSRAVFRIPELLKQSRPGFHVGELRFTGYAPDRRLCVVTVLKEYLKRTLMVRGTAKQLFLTCRPPIHAASRDTIRRWTRDVLKAAGIDLGMFRPHSTRSAACSKVVPRLTMATILKTAGWTRESTFQTYYNKPIVTAFAEAVLK